MSLTTRRGSSVEGTFYRAKTHTLSAPPCHDARVPRPYGFTRVRKPYGRIAWLYHGTSLHAHVGISVGPRRTHRVVPSLSEMLWLVAL